MQNPARDRRSRVNVTVTLRLQLRSGENSAQIGGLRHDMLTDIENAAILTCELAWLTFFQTDINKHHVRYHVRDTEYRSFFMGGCGDEKPVLLSLRTAQWIVCAFSRLKLFQIASWSDRSRQISGSGIRFRSIGSKPREIIVGLMHVPETKQAGLNFKWIYVNLTPKNRLIIRWNTWLVHY